MPEGLRFRFSLFLPFCSLRGFLGTISKMMDTNIIRVGKHMGTDELGNNYYEALPGDTVVERKRWVEPNRYYFDASEIPAHWHGWMHYVTDKVPTEDDKKDILFNVPHRMNLTGTERAYRPEGYLFQKHNRLAVSGSMQEEAELSAADLNAELAAKRQ